MNFQDEDKVVELARRGGALTNLEAKQAIKKGISNGKGGVRRKNKAFAVRYSPEC